MVSPNMQAVNCKRVSLKLADLRCSKLRESCSIRNGDVKSIVWTGLNKTFVPEGRNDSSLAVYCQEYVQERNRPAGNGVIGAEGTFSDRGR